MEIIRTNSSELATISEGNKESEKFALCLPGRLDTKDYGNFTSHLKTFAANGFYAVSFDPPGTWDSPGSTELFTTTNYIKAVNELIEHFGNRPTVILGHSRGGATATLAGTDNPNVVGLLLVNPSLSTPTPPSAETLRTGVYIAHRDIPPGTKNTKDQKEFRSSLIYFEDGEKYSDFETLKRCKKPKVIFYSENDEFNSPEKIKEVFAQIPEPKELVLLQGSHDYRLFPETIKAVDSGIESFIKKYFPE